MLNQDFLTVFWGPDPAPKNQRKLSKEIYEQIFGNFSGPYQVPNIFLKKKLVKLYSNT